MRETNYGFWDYNILKKGEENENNKLNVIDWYKVAETIIDKKPLYVEAGLKTDWNHTYVTLLENNIIETDIGCGYLGSTWAIPAIILKYANGHEEEIELFTIEDNYDSDIMWDDKSIELLKQNNYIINT